jgi:hypothetical protein
VLLDPDPTAPDWQEPAEAMHQPLPPAGCKSRWAAPEEPDARLCGQGVHDEKRVHPAAMSRADDEIAAGREMLLAGGRNPEPEQAEDDGPGDEPDQPVEDRGPRLRRPTEPLKSFEGAATSVGERLGRDPARRRPAAAPGRLSAAIGLCASAGVHSGGRRPGFAD